MKSPKITTFLFAILVPVTIISVALHAEEHTRQKRGVVGCPFIKQAGLNCRSCTEVIVCLPFNIGIARACGKDKPYCVNGKCSETKGAWCSNSTTSSPATSSSDSDSTTSATATTEYNCDFE